MTRVTPTRRLAHYLRARHDEDCLAAGLRSGDAGHRHLGRVDRAEFVLDRQAGRLAQSLVVGERGPVAVGNASSRDDPGCARCCHLRASRAAAQRHGAGCTLSCSRSRCSPDDQSRRLRHSRAGPTSTRPPARQERRLDPTQLRWPGSGPLAAHAARIHRLRPLHAGAGSLLRTDPPPVGCGSRSAPHAAGRCWRTRECLDPAAEIDAAARWAAERLDGEPRDGSRSSCPIWPRRDEVRRIIDRVLAPATGLTGGPAPESQAFELAAARPLAEQPIVAAALDLLDAFVHHPTWPAASRLLRSPFLPERRGGGRRPRAARRAIASLRGAPGSGLRRCARMAADHGCPADRRTHCRRLAT